MTLTRSEKIRRLTESVRAMAAEADVEALAKTLPSMNEAVGLEAAGLESLDQNARPESGLDKVLAGREDRLTDDEILGLEAIIMPQGRPAVFIRKGIFDDLSEPWQHLNMKATRERVQQTFAAIGRIELPNSHRIPYGGTGFVVGSDLLMTNRHVAKLFTDGLGSRGLVYRPGDAAVDFNRHHGDEEDDRTAYVEVKQVVMIHPYWDMALLRVAGLGGILPLTLSVETPEDLIDHEIAAIGYPARDERSDLVVQDRIFQRVYGVKRFQPGKIRRRESIRSFETTVSAMTHDSSTLGGNSGSTILDLTSGHVIGLHFAGIYLKANYAVPAHELARDPRVVDAGVNFSGRVKATGDFDTAWRQADRHESPDGFLPEDRSAPEPALSNAPVVPPLGGTSTWTLPIQINVTVGQPVQLSAMAVLTPASPTHVEAMRVPTIHTNLETRTGYQSDFLDLHRDLVPLPELTAAGRKMAAKQDDGSYELRYHHFSIVMHKGRRLAMFTAANVDWREESRRVNGRKPSRRELTELGPNDVERWVTDPRIPESHQLPDVFYTKDRGTFDKGHLVRRDDVSWGESFEDMQKGNGDTYHTTNCSPQVGAFNQSARGEDNWGDLENLVQKQTKAERVCVFSGPVLAEDDPVFRGRDVRGELEVQIPRSFWKIIVAAGESGPAAYGFVLEQDLSSADVEMAVPAAWKRYMMRIADIENALSGLAKLAWLKKHDEFSSVEGETIAEAVKR